MPAAPRQRRATTQPGLSDERMLAIEETSHPGEEVALAPTAFPRTCTVAGPSSKGAQPYAPLKPNARAQRYPTPQPSASFGPAAHCIRRAKYKARSSTQQLPRLPPSGTQGRNTAHKGGDSTPARPLPCCLPGHEIRAIMTGSPDPYTPFPR